MWCRFGLTLLGLLFLACAAGGIYVIVLSPGPLGRIVEGLRATLFAAIGLSFVAVACLANRSMTKTLLRDFLRDVFSRRNLMEFVTFWVVVAAALAIMLWVRP